jgi:hypothetical protein
MLRPLSVQRASSFVRIGIQIRKENQRIMISEIVSTARESARQELRGNLWQKRRPLKHGQSGSQDYLC